MKPIEALDNIKESLCCNCNKSMESCTDKSCKVPVWIGVLKDLVDRSEQ